MSIRVNINNLSLKNKVILENINFECLDNTITAVIGRNGSGKSTLVNAIASNVNYNGNIFINEYNILNLLHNDKSKLISFIFQNLNTPHIKVKELVVFGRIPYTNLNNKLTQEDLYIVNEAIKNSKIDDIKDCYLDNISGGEIKKAYFGMMLSQNTKNIVLDEATSSMDKDNERKFLSLVKDITHKNNKCTLFIMHNIDNAIRYCDNILLLDNGKQVFFGKTEELIKTDLIEKYFNLERFTINNEIFFK